jgi:hypothetical protein
MRVFHRLAALAGLAALALAVSGPAQAEPNTGGDFGRGLHQCAFGEGGYGYRVGEVNCPGGAVLCTKDHDVMCCRPNAEGGRDCNQISAGRGALGHTVVAPGGQAIAPQPNPAPRRPEQAPPAAASVQGPH